jgi:hypothetical protein
MLLFHWIGAACPIDTPIARTGGFPQLKSGRTSAPRLPAGAAHKLRLDVWRS